MKKPISGRNKKNTAYGYVCFRSFHAPLLNTLVGILLEVCKVTPLEMSGSLTFPMCFASSPVWSGQLMIPHDKQMGLLGQGNRLGADMTSVCFEVWFIVMKTGHLNIHNDYE